MNRSCSIIIIAYNSRDFLPACLQSIREALNGITSEIIVLDNGSKDPIQESEKKHFSEVLWLESKENLGFGKGCNLAASYAKNKYLFFINPDTIVSKTAFSEMLSFMENHAEAGAVGCRILNENGTLQLACRRSFPSPLSTIFKTIGLASLFPKSKFFASYNMTYLDPEQITKVDAISGSFFCMQKELFDKVQGFDKDYFMYGEDLDLFLRIKKLGYHNYYVPTANILHFRGQSSKTRRLKSYIDFYQAMLIFVKKHRRFHLPYVIMALGILFAAFIGVFSRLLPASWKVLPDLFLVIAFYFGLNCLDICSTTFQITESFKSVSFVFCAGVFLIFLFSGEYIQKSLDIKNNFKVLIAWTFISSIFVYIQAFANYFGIAILFVLPIALFLWRRIAFWFYYFYCIFTKQRHRAILLGGGEDDLEEWFDRYHLTTNFEILGSVMNRPEEVSEQNRKYLLGPLSEMENICRRSGCAELWVKSNQSGSHEFYNISELLKLGVQVYLLVGSPKNSNFALVNLKYLQ